MKYIFVALVLASAILMANSDQIQINRNSLISGSSLKEDPFHWPVNDCSSFSCMDITDLIFSNKPTIFLEFNFTVVTFCL